MYVSIFKYVWPLNLQAPTPQDDQTHSNNSITADKFFECVWSFCEVGT